MGAHGLDKMSTNDYNAVVIEILHELSDLTVEIQQAVWLKQSIQYSKLVGEYWSNMRQLEYLRRQYKAGYDWSLA
jgi:hypothetical protein